MFEAAGLCIVTSAAIVKGEETAHFHVESMRFSGFPFLIGKGYVSKTSHTNYINS